MNAIYTTDQLTAAGGKLWETEKFHRVYFNDLASLYGLQISHYNTGNICSAKLDGQKISNTKARKLCLVLSDAKFFYDLDEQGFRIKSRYTIDIDKLVSAITARIQSAEAE